jgi:hypothetical protein
MTDPEAEYGERIRRALHAAADGVVPSGDGLERIRARIAQKPARDRLGLGMFLGLGLLTSAAPERPRAGGGWLRPVAATAGAVLVLAAVILGVPELCHVAGRISSLVQESSPQSAASHQAVAPGLGSPIPNRGNPVTSPSPRHSSAEPSHSPSNPAPPPTTATRHAPLSGRASLAATPAASGQAHTTCPTQAPSPTPTSSPAPPPTLVPTQSTASSTHGSARASLARMAKLSGGPRALRSPLRSPRGRAAGQHRRHRACRRGAEHRGPILVGPAHWRRTRCSPPSVRHPSSPAITITSPDLGISTSAGRGPGDGSGRTAHATALIIPAAAYVTASSAIPGIHLVEGVVVDCRGLPRGSRLSARARRPHPRT